jgi:hypothetical protein
MDYKRQQSRFTQKGIKLNCPIDAVPDDRLAIGTNVRPTQDGALGIRPAIAPFLAPSSYPIHSLRGFNANGVNYTFSGAGYNLYLGNVLADTGYSGNPLTFASYQPLAAVQPFLYVADSARYSKVRAADRTRFAVGTPPPGSPPDAELGSPLYSVVDNFDSAAEWTAGEIAGTPADALRVPTGTTTAAVLYDSSTTGWACVAFSSLTTDWLTKGALIGIGTEVAVISDMIPAAATNATTIAAIQYDSGTTGACCVVLTSNTALLDRDSLVQMGSEFVRVLSVALGEDNAVSFRCSTSGAHAAAEAVAFYDSARMYLTANHLAAESVTGGCVTALFTPTSSTNEVGTISETIALDLSQINNRPITADDWMHISLAFDTPGNLLMVRILLDVDGVSNDFLHNYYWAEITSNVLQAASTGSQSLLAAQQGALTQQVTSAQLAQMTSAVQQIQLAQAQMAAEGLPTTQLTQQIASLQAQIAAAGGISGGTQLATGSGAWSEVFIPISTLLANRVGTDVTRTLANIAAIRVEVTCSAAVNMSADSWWIGGTYGPNCPGSIYPDNPIKYCYRYRSTITGAQSTWSPLNRGGLFPERMPVVVTGACSTDLQVDTVDIARVGASVNGTPVYATSIPNTGTTWSYADNYADAQLGDQIEQVDFQPWPVQQNPITGTCSVVGTTVFSTSVAIPANLCIGTEVLINGVATVIRGAPGANTFQVEDNIDTATGVPFQINSPTTYGNPLPYLTGPYDETFFAWGDPINPGRVYFTNRTNPETANTSNFIDLTSSAEPGMGICTWNGYVVAMTANRFFAGTTTGNAANPYSFAETSVGAGLLVPWCFDTGPLIFFLSRNGIMATDLGPAKSLSGDDLYPFLPHEGQPGVTVNGYEPPMLYPAPRLCYCKNGWLYFDYQTSKLPSPPIPSPPSPPSPPPPAPPPPPGNTYTLTVINGTGSGTYAEGAVVPIVATCTPPFSEWTAAGDYTSGISSPTDSSTTFTMPAENATLTANCCTVGATLTQYAVGTGFRGASGTATLGAVPTVGNMLVLAIMNNVGANFDSTNLDGLGWINALGTGQQTEGGSFKGNVYYKVAGVAEPQSVTINMQSELGSVAFVVMEWAGLNGIDQIAYRTDNEMYTGGPFYAETGVVTTTAANELVIAIAGISLPGAPYWGASSFNQFVQNWVLTGPVSPAMTDMTGTITYGETSEGVEEIERGMDVAYANINTVGGYEATAYYGGQPWGLVNYQTAMIVTFQAAPCSG